MRHETFTTPGLVTTDDPRNLKGSTDFVLSTCGKQLPLEELASVVDANVLPMDLRSKNSIIALFCFCLFICYMVVLVTCGTVHECGHFLCRQCNLRHSQVATRGQAQSLWQTPNICETHNYSLCPLYLQPHWALYAFCLCTVNRTCTKSQCTSLSKMLSTEKNTTPSGKCLCFFSLICLLCLEPSTPNQSSVTREAGT